MTNFIDIYSRAMTMLNSPVLSSLQQNDLYTFNMVMNQYLQTAMTFYNPNAQVEARIANNVPMEDGIQTIVGDGTTTVFEIVSTPLPSADAIFKIVANEREIKGFSFNSTTNQITFDYAPAPDVDVDICWVNDGNFASITNEDITLLSIGICWAWAIQTQNNQLDIDRQPNDSDFKLHAEGTTIKGKIDWVKHFEEMFHREMSRADWRPLFRRGK